MIPRRATRTLRQMAAGFPVLVLTGPRQSGKTTLARETFPHLPYVAYFGDRDRSFRLKVTGHFGAS